MYCSLPKLYRVSHSLPNPALFNNFTISENMATKFEADYRHTLHTYSFSFLTQRTYSCNIFIGVRIIKEMPGSVASGTHCIINQQDATLAVLCLLKTTSMLYMFRTPFASIFRSTINCNSSHWCMS